MRPHENLGWRVLLADIREQKQRQECTTAALYVHPPPSTNVKATVEVPASVAWISRTRKTNGNLSADALAPNPAARAEKLVVHLAQRRRSAGGGKRWAFGTWQADDRLAPRERIARVHTSGA